MAEERKFATEYYLDVEDSMVCEECMSKDLSSEPTCFAPYQGPFTICIDDTIFPENCDECGIEFLAGG